MNSLSQFLNPLYGKMTTSFCLWDAEYAFAAFLPAFPAVDNLQHMMLFLASSQRMTTRCGV